MFIHFTYVTEVHVPPNVDPLYTGHESYVVTSFKNKNTISISQHLLDKITVLGKTLKEGTVSDLSSVAYMTRKLACIKCQLVTTNS